MQTWLEKILDDFEAIEEAEFDANSLGEEFPEWVRNIFLWLLQASFPKVKMPSEKRLEPKSVGSLVAYKFLYANLVNEWAKNPNPLLKEIGGEMSKASPQVFEATRRALSAAVDAPFNESAEFLNGVGRIFVKRKPQAVTKRHLTLFRTQAVYLFLMSDWQSVPTRITSTQLFFWLDKRLPAEVIGTNPDWIRGICTRIKFPLAREGRPPKKKRR